MPDYPFRVGRSRTGLGLFAVERIERGKFIAEYTGPRISNEEADRLERRGSKYMFTLNSKWTVDGSGRDNIARYANHSCRPNAESDIVRGRVVLRATRVILPGREITYNYGKDYFDTMLKPIGCKCAHCRKKRAEQRAAQRAAAKKRNGKLNGKSNGRHNGRS